MKKSFKRLKPVPRVFAEIVRFLGWWLAFSGLCIVFTPASHCGSLGCATSTPLSTWLMLGGLLALLMTGWRHWGLYQEQKQKNRKSKPD